MKKFTIISIFLVFISVQCLCAKSKGLSKKVPSWLLDINSEYPVSDFIAQLGEGFSKQEAEIDGINRISNYFDSNIDTVTTGKISMSEKKQDSEIKDKKKKNQSENFSKKSELETVTKISSNVDLFAIRYSEPYKDKKTKKFYVVSYIDRNEAYKIYRPKVEIPAKQFSAYYSNAEDCLQKEDYLKAVKYLKNAKKIIPEFEEPYAFASLLNPSKSKEFEKIHNQILKLDSKIMKALQNSQINISVENDLDGIIAAKTETLFSNFGFPVNGENGKYKVLVSINLDERNQQKGTSYYPHVNITIKKDSETIFSMGKDGEKVSAIDSEIAKKRAYKAVEEMIESVIAEEFDF